MTPKQRAKIYRKAGILLEKRDMKGVSDLFHDCQDTEVLIETKLFYQDHKKWANSKRRTEEHEKENDSVRLFIFFLCEQIALNPCY